MDAGALDADLDAGFVPDGPIPDGGPPPPPEGELLAEGVCAHDGAVSLAPDGALVAYVTCTGDRAVWTLALPGGSPVRVDDAADDATVLFSPDGAWLLYETPAETRVRDPAAAQPAQTVFGGAVDEARFIQLGATSEIRLLVMLTDGATRRVDMLTDADGFASVATLIEHAGIVGDLSLVSGSRDTLLVTVDDGGTSYRRVPTDGVSALEVLPIDPATTLFGPVGLGNTHGIAAIGGALSFVEFATGTGVELAPDGVRAADARFDVTFGVDRYVYFLRDGDVTRRLRNGTAAAETLAVADADGLALTGNGARLLYTSAGELMSVDLQGTSTASLGAYADGIADVAVSPDGAELAYVRSGALVVSPTETASMDAVRDDADVVAGSAGYAGDGALIWRRATDPDGLTDALRSGDPAQTRAAFVSEWWPVPGGGAVLYRSTADELRRL